MDSRKRKARKEVTLAQVATAAHVSIKTASLALRRHPTVTREVAQSVASAAKALGYRPKTGRRPVLGIVAPQTSHIAYGELISFIRGLASSYDVLTLIAETGGDVRMERRAVEEFTRSGVDGMILIGPRMPAVEIEDLSVRGQSIVTVNFPVGRESEYTFSSIEVDNRLGALQAVEFLATRGRERIAYVAGRPPSTSERHRREGYLAGLEALGPGARPLIVEMEVEAGMASPTLRSGYEQCRRLMAEYRAEGVNAVICYNDVVAIGALRALREEHVKVPDDVAVIGFDNISLGQYSAPSLTTVGVQWEQIVSLIVDRLHAASFRDVGAGLLPQGHRVLEPRLIERESTPRS